MQDPGTTKELLTALSRIARGDPRNGNPLSRIAAQMIAREALTHVDWNWRTDQPNWIEAAAVVNNRKGTNDGD